MNMTEPFEQAVRQHGGTVLRVCRAVLGAGTDADDAWSETFLSALKAWPTLDAAANIEAWLVRIAHRKALDITRARARHAIPMAELPEQAAIDGLEDRDVWVAVKNLPPKQRLAIAYHYLGGLTHVETAELLDSTPEAVRRAAADGIKRLRRMYGSEDQLRGEL